MTQHPEPELYQIGLSTKSGAASAAPARAERVYWRSVDELGGAGYSSGLPGHEQEQERPGPELAHELASRRQFLRLMGASLALAGVAGCGVQPLESIVPYVEQPDLIEYGKPLFFATAMPTAQGSALGVLVRSHEGRPTKIEGNPSHPMSIGATDAFAQAEILTLYDPDRSQVVLHRGRVNTWERFQAAAVELRRRMRKDGGRGFRLLTGTVTSPTLGDQIGRLLKQCPEARWHCYEPAGRDGVREGIRLAFGEPHEPRYHLDRAEVIVSLESDLLACDAEGLRHARDFAARRDVDRAPAGSGATMNRLYVVESTPSLTGAAADHRLVAASSEVVAIAQALARALKVEGMPPGPSAPSRHEAWISAVARELEGHRGRSLIVAGDCQPASVHVLALAVNQALGNVGKTVTFHPSPAQGPAGGLASLRELARDMHEGRVDTLLMLGVNPAYDAPADLEFAELLRSDRVGLRIHLGLYEDETAELSHWHLPQAHFLEAWSDVRAADGTASIQQPLIAPLYQGRSPHEVVSTLLGEVNRSSLEAVREFWRRRSPSGDFEAFWRRALVEGLIPGTSGEPKDVTFRRESLAGTAEQGAAQQPDGLELVFRPDPTIWDGRHANNGWLQELPKPLTRLTWGNAALISKPLADRLGLTNGDMLELGAQGRAVRLPAWIQPGQAENSVTVHLGHGRWRAGRVGTGIGFNVNAVRTSDRPWFLAGLELRKTGETFALAAVQHHHQMEEGRNLIRSGTLQEFLETPAFAQEPDREHGPALSLYPERPRGEHAENAWGMAIDLNRCLGCGACVVACQAENNIPIVGRDEVLRSREMHWLRIDRYYEGDDAANPSTHFQPVLCQHCEKAPCELVCPVGATTHSDEGLNEMTYNRCVGTRYCSNNCPYKVRRFNFFTYADHTSESLKLMRNPEVTVRSRGVMEKCTYCVQRINHARITSKIEGRPVGGDEVVTACQGACPTRAIVFGNLADPRSAVVQSKSSPRNYALLAELNTVPRTTYLASLTNPNPELETPGRRKAEANDGHTAS